MKPDDKNTEKATGPDTPEPDPADEASPETPADEPGPEDPIAELTATVEQGFGQIGEILAAQQARLEKLEQAPAPTPAPAADVVLPEAKRQVPKDTVRFFSPNRGLRLILEPAGAWVENGQRVTKRGRDVTFSNGIFDTSDEALIAELREHRSYRHRFWEDAAAVPTRTVAIHDGPKTSGQLQQERPRDPLAARL